MQYPIDTVLARLTQRAERLRSHVPQTRADADAEYDRKIRSHGDVIAVAERRRGEMAETIATDGITWGEVYTAGRELADSARQAMGAVGDGPSYKTADAYERDAREVEGLAELIRSTGAKTIPTSELEKLGALRWVR